MEKDKFDVLTDISINKSFAFFCLFLTRNVFFDLVFCFCHTGLGQVL